MPTRRGFDEWLGLPYSNDMWPHYPQAKPGAYPDLPMYDGEKVLIPAMTHEDQNTMTTRCTERALAFIERNKDKPFFFYLAHSNAARAAACEREVRRQVRRGTFR